MWKGLLIIGLVTTYGATAEYDESPIGSHKLFREWQTEYDIYYEDPFEDNFRYQIFRQNLNDINVLNEQFRGVTRFAPNKFCALSSGEFRARILMSERAPTMFEADEYMPMKRNHTTLPTHFDWRSKNMVSSVKNQGSAGSCWAFSAVANIESQWAIQGKPLTNLSVEQIVDCDATEDIKRRRADCGIFGGWPYLAYQYVKRQGGLEPDTSYPYCSGGGGAPGTCYVCSTPGYNKTLCGPPVPWCNLTCTDRRDPTKFVTGLRVAGWSALTKNETELAHQLVSVGPLSIAMDATLLQFYHSGVFDPPAWMCPVKSINHALLITGFGTASTWLGTKDYWIVKNSWGPTWGLNGYFWVRRGLGTCGVNSEVTTAILQK